MWSQSKDLHLDDHPRAATKLREMMVTRLLLAAAALSCAAPGAAFMGNAPSFGLRRASVSQRAGACSLRAQAQVGETVLGRRDVLKAPVAASLAAAISFAASPAPVRAEDTLDSPIVVFGAGGGTGAACVEYCSVTAEIPCRAVRRAAVTSKGKETAFPEVDASLLAVAQGDVTDPKSVAEAVKGARAVIFAASASKKGGDPEAVDYKGLLNVAKACIDAKVPRLVVVSSGAVSKPDSAIYQLLNLFGKIMYWKKKGEDEMIAMYKASGDDSLSYTIVRPGGLSDEAGQGPKAMELNQGDEKSGKISRADVAAICVQCVEFPSAADTTFECYTSPPPPLPIKAATAKKLETAAEKLPFAKKDDKPFTSGREMRGETWPALFGQLKKDA